MSRNHTKNGYSLVEVLVAVSILMLSIVGPITIAAKAMQSAQFVRQQDTAFFLAQEGISLANSLRNDGELAAYTTGEATDPWSWVTNPNLSPCFFAQGCDIDARDDTLLDNVVNCATSANSCTLLYDNSKPQTQRAVYQHVSGTATPYTRVITFTVASGNEVMVKVAVSWNASLLHDTQTVTLQTSLFNLYNF